jgi:hypothetical protein
MNENSSLRRFAAAARRAEPQKTRQVIQDNLENRRASSLPV